MYFVYCTCAAGEPSENQSDTPMFADASCEMDSGLSGDGDVIDLPPPEQEAMIIATAIVVTIIKLVLNKLMMYSSN